MKLNVFCEEVKSPKVTKKLIKEIVTLISIEEDTVFGDINIIFCSDVYLLNINNEYLKHDYYTDIITFDYKNENSVSSDMFISLDRVQENSNSIKIPFNHELLRIIIHGTLHLSGYEDDTLVKRKYMSLKEDYYLAKIF